MANAVGDEWDGHQVRQVTAGGKVTGSDEMWEPEFQHWDRAGVPDEMILLARPLIEAGGEAKAAALRVLTRLKGTFAKETPNDERRKLIELLTSNDLHNEGRISASRARSDDGLLADWEEDYGAAGRRREGL